MKASLITALTWAACTVASPVVLNARHDDCTCVEETLTLTLPASTGGTLVEPTPTDTNTATATATVPEETSTATWSSTNTITATSTATVPGETSTTTAPPTPVPTPGDCENGRCHGTGHLVQDLAPQVNRLLTVTGADGEDFLVQVNEDVYNLLSGRVSLSESVGEIVGDAASIGDLIADLGPIIDCILTIVGEDSHILLVRLSPEIADLLRGAGATLGLDAVTNPVGQVVKSLGLNIKRDQLDHFDVHGLDGNSLPVQIPGALGKAIANLHFETPVGTVIATGIEATKIIQKLGPRADGFLAVLGEGTGLVLIRLAPQVARVVKGLAPELANPVGNVVGIFGDSL
ncbi:hypothetical protein ASPVEDRAFT_42983 [Aspergillus versicolor CBS 583.65]|uniref:Uncharacterized protein n=1 Tax=Aspergillus versicolor CBS 583.65 TaxID=1036611 RepID=A0A1L9PPY9_ASPVE|nr:uncharacterized protein ASPVEDRAFT_42983 [Aspergillus versicolor CBS 583.65]OJJ03516.1 hypothetical protein ASPVEDRAFT_42983 [Aspergillus versicolor CBS 583.65]